MFTERFLCLWLSLLFLSFLVPLLHTCLIWILRKGMSPFFFFFLCPIPHALLELHHILYSPEEPSFLHSWITWLFRVWLDPGMDTQTRLFSSVTQLCLTFCKPMDWARQASLSITNSQSLLKLMSITSVMSSNHLILSSPSPPAFSLWQHQGLYQWVSYSHQVANVLELQLKHQCKNCNYLHQPNTPFWQWLIIQFFFTIFQWSYRFFFFTIFQKFLFHLGRWS